MTDETFEGGCFCGAVRFAMRGRPMFIHACHCKDCRRQSGGPFVIINIAADSAEVGSQVGILSRYLGVASCLL